MEVEIAKNSGLCYGVKRALNLAKETRQKKEGEIVESFIGVARVIEIELKIDNAQPVQRISVGKRGIDQPEVSEQSIG